MKHINRRPFLNHMVFDTSLAEQHRIVARVDGLRALCDRLEAGLRIAEDTRRLLLESLLNEVHPSRETARRREARAGA